MEYRIEHDALGEVRVPAAALWGAQTQRSLENFPIGDEKMPLEQIRALALVKKAAAAANRALRRSRRRVPPLRLADGQRHADQHESQRGHRAPRQHSGR